MGNVDLIGRKLTPVEEQALKIYEDLKEFVAMPDLPPCAQANARVALAAISLIIDDLDIDFEYLYEYGV